MHTALGADAADPAFAPEEPSQEALAAARRDHRRGDRAALPRPARPARARARSRGRGEEVRERLRSISHVGAGRPHDPPPRRLPPRPGALGARRLGHPRLRGRAGPVARRAPPQALAAARRRRDAALVRLRRLGRGPGRRRRAPGGWESASAEEFLGGYLETVDRVLLPGGQGAVDRLLSLFELEKAVYELRYELNHRPDWVGIPVAGILRLLEECTTLPGRPARRAEPGSARPRDADGRCSPGPCAHMSSARPQRRAMNRWSRSSCTTRTPRSAAHPTTAASSSAPSAPTPSRSSPGRKGTTRSSSSRPASRASSRASSTDVGLPLRYELEVRYADGNTITAHDPYCVPADARRARPPPRRRGPPRGALGAPRRARARGRRRQRHRLRGVGAERARVSVVGDFNGWDGARPPDALARRHRRLGAVRPRASADGERYKFEIRRADGCVVLKADPFALATEVPPADGLDRPRRSRHEWARRGVDRRRERGRRACTRADVDLRGAPRLVARATRGRQPLADATASSRDELADYVQRPGLHARRAAAGDGAPVLAARGATR